MTQKTMPAIFFGHGNPLNALEDNRYTQAWRAIAASLTPPRAVLAISAHWYVPETAVTAMNTPRTIHDFAGFPQDLYEVQYPAPGDPALAQRICALLGPTDVRLDHRWGLDHGTWSVLRHVFPTASVPVLQLSIDASQPARFHYELGARLAPLREEGVLIIGSGNLVHNLRTYAWDRRPVEPFDWAVRFEQSARNLLLSGDHSGLINYGRLGRDAELCVPTPEHYLPLLFVLGLRRASDTLGFPVEGIEGGSVSMLAVRLG